MAAAIIAPIIASMASVAATTTWVVVASQVIALGISMALASALRPNLGDVSIDGQGQALKTSKTNTAVVPIVYGENKLAGNIIWQTTNDYNGGATNKDYWAIIAISDGYVNDFISVYSDEYIMDSSTEDIHTLDFQHIHTHDTSGDGVNVSDITFVTDSGGTTAAGSTIFGAVSVTPSSNTGDASYLTDGDLSTGWSPTSMTAEHILLVDNDSTPLHSCRVYIMNSNPTRHGEAEYSFKIQYSANGTAWSDGSAVYSENGGSGNSWVDIEITETAAHLYWRVYFTTIKHDEFGDGNWTVAEVFEIDFSTNIAISVTIPSDISYMAVHHLYDATDNPSIQNITALVEGRVMDYFSSADPLPIEYSAISARVVYDIMKEVLNVGIDDIDIDSFEDAQTYCATNGFDCNMVFGSKQNADSALQAALATMRGHLTYTAGSWKLIYDSPQSSIDSLTDDDILNNTLTISAKPSADIANIVTVRYVNPDDEWQVASVEARDDNLILLDGQEIEQILEVRGCTSKVQAEKLAQLTLNQMRYSEDASGNRISQSPLSVSFTTSVKNAHLEVGDVVTITHDLLSFPRKFKLVSIETDQSGAITIDGTEYCDIHYEDISGTAIIV